MLLRAIVNIIKFKKSRLLFLPYLEKNMKRLRQKPNKALPSKNTLKTSVMLNASSIN